MADNDLLTMPFIDLVPDSISGDPIMAGAAEAIDPQLKAAADNIVLTIILARLDEQPETVVDFLAWQFHVDAYDRAETLAQKRNMVRRSIEMHRYKGTPWAVETALDALDYPAEVVEWFDYGGSAFYFKVLVDVSERGLDTNTWDEAEAIALAWKNLRSWLDGVQVWLSQSNKTPSVLIAPLSGEIITVYPWQETEVSESSPSYVAAGFGLLAEIVTVYPDPGA